MLDELDVRHFKFISGEQIVSCVINQNKEEYILQMPLQVHVTVEQSKQNFFFTKWMPLSKSDVCTINLANVVSQSSVAEDMKYRYVSICNEYKTESSKEETPDWMSELDDEQEDFDYDISDAPKSVH